MNLINKYLGDNEINEAGGYTMKPKDKKIIKSFINGDKKGTGKALWIDGDYLFGPMTSTTTDYIAKRDKEGNISVGKVYGNITQTFHNFIKKSTPKLMFNEEV